MANAAHITRSTREKSFHYELHVLRRAYVQLLQRIDDAVVAQRDLEFASHGQPRGVMDPSVSAFLRACEAAWDDVTDSMSATMAAVTCVDDTYPLVGMAYAIREILAAECGAEFHNRIADARRQIATICVRPEMSIVMKDCFQVLRATADRLTALDSLHIYECGTRNDFDVSP